MANKWSKPEEKLSHENKTLRKHIEEVSLLLDNFLKFYNFDQKYFKIADFLAEYHDYGKLHRDWEMGKKSGHSHHSYEYLLEKNIVFEDKKLNPVLQFLILRHHSILSKRIGERLSERKIEIKGKEFPLRAVFEVVTEDKLKETIYSLSKNKKQELINLSDVFGLFKLADTLSAEGKTSFELEKPEVKTNIIQNIFSNQTDEKRWKEQEKLLSLPDIGLLRAYTGWGKTTAGLLFFSKKHPAKIFYLMPTITAINKFYETLNNVFDNKVSKYFYFLDTELKEDEEKLSQLFFFKNFITPYVITTIDQFLLSFLQTGKYYTKRVMFRNSGLIIDEVHLLNPLMLQLVTYFIKVYKELYNLKVLFMSATLPDSMVKYLQDEIGIQASGFLDFSKGYIQKKRIMWEWIDEDIEKHTENIVKKIKDGKKVLVVVNTVEKAIELGKKLEKEYELEYGKDFIVFHARFMYIHRKNKEEWIDRFKKKPHIVIATQVCEVSLDISYDILFTELASLPALVQRFGRINRYGNITKDVNVYIFNPEIKDKKRYPYSWEEIQNSREVISEFEKEKLKNEKMLLNSINSVLTYEKLINKIEETKKEVKIDNWNDITHFFFSLEIDDERAKKLLNYREGFTIMIIPDPKCIEDEIKDHVENLLSRKVSTLSFNERVKFFAQIKETAVPVPIWWMKNAITTEEKGFSIIDFKDKVYDEKYGFHELKGEVI